MPQHHYKRGHAVYVGIDTPFISEWLRRSAGIGYIKPGVVLTAIFFASANKIVWTIAQQNEGLELHISLPASK